MKASCVDMPSINMYRVMDALELIVVVDDMLALRWLVWLWVRLWDAREGRAEGDQGRDHDEPHLITEIQNKNVTLAVSTFVVGQLMMLVTRYC